MSEYTEKQVDDLFDRLAKGIKGYVKALGMKFVTLWRESDDGYVSRGYLVYSNLRRSVTMLSMSCAVFSKDAEISVKVSPLYVDSDGKRVMRMSRFMDDDALMNQMFVGVIDSLQRTVFKDAGDGQVEGQEHAG